MNFTRVGRKLVGIELILFRKAGVLLILILFLHKLKMKHEIFLDTLTKLIVLGDNQLIQLNPLYLTEKLVS